MDNVLCCRKNVLLQPVFVIVDYSRSQPQYITHPRFMTGYKVVPTDRVLADSGIPEFRSDFPAHSCVCVFPLPESGLPASVLLTGDA